MLKKLLAISTIYLATTGLGNANNMPYFGADLNLQRGDSYTGFIPTFFGGLGTTFGCDFLYYFGGEVYFEGPSIYASGSQANRILYDFGLSGLLGIYVMPNTSNLVYARLGLQASEVKKYDDLRVGATIGVGVQMAWNARWDIRGEYVYVGQSISEDTISMQASNFKLGLIYKLY